MTTGKIVAAVSVYDTADILEDYIRWCLRAGIDLVLAQDWGSTDGSQEILEKYRRAKVVDWLILPERSMLKYKSGDGLLEIARDKHKADWVIKTDSDEFLVAPGGGLREVLREAGRDDVTVLNVPCFNMTGRPPDPSIKAIRQLNLRIVRPVETDAQRASGGLPVPYIFIRHPIKTIVRSSAFVGYKAGTHGATTSFGTSREVPGLHFLHYPYRRFGKFKKKVAHTAEWFRDNPHLPPWWGWHWRRWIELDRTGRLREEFDSQFVSPEREAELVRDGTCVRDETVAAWSTGTPRLSRFRPAASRLFGVSVRLLVAGNLPGRRR